MKPFLLATSLLVALSAPLSAQNDPEPEGPPAPTAQPAANTSTVKPAVPRVSARLIGDIEAHRLEPARYVRRLDDVVQVELGTLDLGKDVVLVIDGEPVMRDEYLRRAVMFGGLQEVGSELTRIITDAEIDRLVNEEGRSRDEFELETADVDGKYNDYLELIKMNAQQGITQEDPSARPTPEQIAEAEATAIAAFEESIHASIGMEAFRNSLLAEVRFEKVFLGLPTEPTPLPEDYPKFGPEAGKPLPDDAPCPPFVNKTTWEAMDYDANTRVMRQLLINSGTAGQPIPALFKGQVTSGIRLGLLKTSGLSWFFQNDDLAPGTVCQILGEDVEATNIWPLIKDQLNELDHELILRELLTLRAMRKTLEAAGGWLDHAETQADFDALEAEYSQTLFPLAAIIMFQGYTDIDRYREHFTYRNAYNKWREATLEESDLEDHFRGSGRLFFEKGAVIADVAYVSTNELEGFTPRSFDLANTKLREAFAGKDSASEWMALMKDFPKPATRAQSGNERNYQRNQLRLRLTESYLSIFLRGYSLADDIFYRGLPGEVFGPFEMTNRRHGWGAEVNAGSWMVRVDGYELGRSLPPMQGQDAAQAREDFLDMNYLYWAQECLKALLPGVSVAS